MSGEEIERTSKHYLRMQVDSTTHLKILDTGCGVGVNAKELSKHGHKIVGVDISPIAIEKFRKNGFEGYQHDLSQAFPFPNEEFDLVFSSDTIEHLVDTDFFLQEASRVLKPEGKLALSTSNSAFWLYRLFAIFGYTLTDIQHPGHVRFFSRRDLVRRIREAGFENISVGGRHIYLLANDTIGKTISPLLKPFGFYKELRFTTKTYFWHLSKFNKRASSFWTDTFIVTATKSARNP